ncbi:MAG: UDP-glucose 4-epimerase GalE [Alphaproteobacteria bacterium]|nr:UDP-glucose 4-epimerase GalE [Alphaproteobacteria bacterium]
MLQQQNILITGGAGYIGSHMALNLTDAGITPVIIDNLCTGFEALLPKNAIFYQEDVGNKQAVIDIIKKHNITSIIHFAASVVVPESVENPLKYYLNNTAQTSMLIQAAVDAGVKYFLFSSTAAVYGVPAVTQVCEQDNLLPINPYGTSKMMSEMVLRDVSNAHNLTVGILRYFNVAGADEQLRAGQMSKNATHLIKVATQTALGKRPHIEIFGSDFETDDGTGVRDYIHVSDLTQIHHQILELMQASGQSQLLNCGYGQGYSVREVLDKIDELSGGEFGGTPIKRIESPRRAGDPAMLIANNSHMKEIIDFKPNYQDLGKIITSALAWEKQLD